MKAGDLALVVRALVEGRAEPTCDREESFVQILGALGDREGQDAIRRAEPHKLHCKLLVDPKFGPSFCGRCPNNPCLPADPRTGKPNPRAEEFERVELYGSIALDALDVAVLQQAGFRPPLRGIVARQLVATAAAELDRAKAAAQARIIAAAIVEALAAIFGSRT